MNLIDTHTHLDSFVQRGELDAVLERATAAGVGALVTVGTGSDDWPLYREIATTHSGGGCAVYYTVGLHPCSVGADWESEVAQIEAYFSDAVGVGLGRADSADAQNKKGARPPVALGECGLDRFHLPKDDPAQAEQVFAWQRAAFSAQLAIARRLGCPVEVHSRGAFAESVALIDESGVDWGKVVFHCFSEGPAEMSELVARGGRGSFTGILTYKNAQSVREAAQVQGLKRLMLETDAPYLTPMPHRGKRPNEPAFLRHTADYAAEFFGVSVETLAEITTRNAREFFGI
ncbi:hydrolase TatD [Cephaloticoccus capnophilus]|uniref:Hydrolase TatD n=1 Tax=Cephaloticoccus capnophilus TaxID=1548208 RepID=A0A139SP13_9BACT|nr:TatD family hydrolase [Cephaloticoccus capnophilus]KXU36339.1 hydrolase TatD [Cephaloticoccus capnophilus]